MKFAKAMNWLSITRELRAGGCLQVACCASMSMRGLVSVLREREFDSKECIQ